MVKKIFEKISIVYNDDNQEHYDAIRITDKGVHIGRIIDNKFEPFGFIPKHNIKAIKNGSKFINRE